MADSTYEKPFLTVEQQIDQIKQRGMKIGSRDDARNALRRIGYYRLSGYWHPDRVPAGPGEKRLFAVEGVAGVRGAVAG